MIQGVGTSLGQDEAEGIGPAGVTTTSELYYKQVYQAVSRFAKAGVLLGDDHFGHHKAGVIALTLARNAVNEAIATRTATSRLLAIASSEAQKARWLFCGSVAVEHARRQNTALTP